MKKFPKNLNTLDEGRSKVYRNGNGAQKFEAMGFELETVRARFRTC